MGIAPLIAAVRRRPAHWKFGVPASAGTAGPRLDGGTGDLIGLKAEIYLGGMGWVDISPYVYYRDMIKITRGRADETSQTQPQTAALTINNRDGRFSSRNPVGPYYGLLVRNTPIRISRLNNGIRRYRFAGEVSSWPATSDISGRDVYEQITASGPLRRLLQGTQSLRSPMTRAYTQGVTSSLVSAYWPCEDPTGATSLASGLSGGIPMSFNRSPQLAQDTSFACSAPLPVTNASTWTAPLPVAPGGPSNVLRFLLKLPASGEADSTLIASMTTTGTITYLGLYYRADTGGSVELVAADNAGNFLFTATTPALHNLNGVLVRVSMEILPSGGSNINGALVIVQPGVPFGLAPNAIIPGHVGQAVSVSMNAFSAFSGSYLNNSVIGHVSYQPTWDSLFDLAEPLNAWVGEPPDAVQPNDFAAGFTGLSQSRFTRLCLENNVSPVVITSAAGYDNDPGPTAPVGMGAQTIDTLATLLQQVPDTTGGIMFEPRDQVGVAIRTRASMYNQAPRLTLDHAQHQLSAPLNPVDDDQLTRNDIEVTRVGGSSAIAQQTTGPLSMAAPPDGVGDYQTQYQLSLASDSLLADAAGWRLHMGTVDEPRYPSININLRHPTFTSNVDLLNGAITLDIGDRILINNPPPEFPPDPISLIVQGYSETLGNYEHDMVINCSPESPYRVAVLVAVLDDAVLAHLDTDGSTLAVTYPLGTETSIQVATTDPSMPLWTTSAGDFPFDISVAGERMTVTNITGSSSPQTFTVTRSVNGVVKTQTAGTDVRLQQPMILSL